MRRALCALLPVLLLAGPARAEMGEITVAEQFGVSVLPLMMMERLGLAEKHAKEAGIELKVRWVQVAGPSVMNDGLLSGALQFASQGAPSMITLWDRTRRNVGIKGVAAITTYPLYLLSRNPAVHTIKDLTASDKIAVPSVKISTQAIMLQIAAADAFGEGEYARLDPLTISLAHPDATAAFTTDTAGVNAHFSSSPFYEQEIKVPGAHLVTTNYAILGGPATALILTASTRFREANPTVFRAFYDGLAEAIDIVNADKPAAARLYLEISKDRISSEAEIVGMIGDKDCAYTLRPAKVMKTAAFMAKVGTIRQAPATLEEMFFPEAAALGGD
ncbi:MAG: ABC transporter substrate-binding protein [Acetobacteraceae bacterium]